MYFGTGWTSWQVLYQPRNVLGTVAFAGSENTGAIFETTFDANTRVIKYADGTMKVIGRRVATSIGVLTAAGYSGFNSVMFAANFGVTFIEAPYVVATLATNTCAGVNIDSITTAAVGLILWNPTSLPGITATVNYEATGRWR